jgi:hypothetical protein
MKIAIVLTGSLAAALLPLISIAANDRGRDDDARRGEQTLGQGNLL